MTSDRNKVDKICTPSCLPGEFKLVRLGEFANDKTYRLFQIKGVLKIVISSDVDTVE